MTDFTADDSEKFPAGLTVADLGEFELVAALGLTNSSPQVLLGVGDDAAVVRVEGKLAISTDVFVQDRHFKLTWATAAQIGRKAAAQALADITAMGGQASWVTVGLSLPKDTEVSWVQQLYQGMKKECALAGATIVGGDMTASREIVISLTVFGQVSNPILRSDAKPGDTIAIIGSLGLAAAGLALLQSGLTAPTELVSAFLLPKPTYAAGEQATSFGASSMVDISDGLIADLRHIANASSVCLSLDLDQLTPTPQLQNAAKRLGVNALDWVLTGGDEHALVATFPNQIPPGWRKIGTVKSGAAQVQINDEEYLEIGGYRHFN